MSNRSQRPSLPIRPDREALSRAGSITPPQQPQQPQIPKQPPPRQNQQLPNQHLQPQQPRYQFKPLARSEVPFGTPKNQVAMFRHEVAIASFNDRLERADPARMAALNALSDTELWMMPARKSWARNDGGQGVYEWLEAVRNRPGLWKRKTGCEFGFVKDNSDQTGKLKGCVVC